MPIESIHRASDSPYVSRVWRGVATGPDTMTSVATTTWELVFWEDGDGAHAAVRGPETSPTDVAIAEESETFGITFAHGAVMPHLPPVQLVDAHRESRRATARRRHCAPRDHPRERRDGRTARRPPPGDQLRPPRAR